MSLPSTLRSSYQLCPIREPDLADELDRNAVSDEGWRRIMALGEPDPDRPSTLASGTVYGNPDRPPSLVELSDAPPQPWCAPRPGVPRHPMTRYELDGGSLVHVHRSPAEAESEAEANAVAIVFDAQFWLRADVATTLDNLAADGAVPALSTVAVESIRGTARHEGLTHPELFEPFLVDQLLPWLRARWSVDEERTVLVGQSLGGLTVAWAARQYPELFGRVVSSSMAAWWPGDDHGGLSGARVVDAYRDGETVPVRFFLEAGSRERELLDSVRTYRDVLEVREYDVTYREYEGGHDLACWRGGVADGLVALLR
jgi:enterochelin esterase family protein